MQLFLIRHAHALDGANDAERPLSSRGRKQVRVLARFLKRPEVFPVREIWHSPLVRSHETAVRLARRLGLRARLVTADGLRPSDDPAVLARQLRRRRQPLAIVGHEPHLSALASLLVAGAADPPVFVLPKCAVLALEHTRGRWIVQWHMAPKLLP